jgi:hypothetical protein
MDTYLLTYSLHGAGYYLKSWLLLSSSINIPLSYGTRRFITVFTKARHWTQSWASRIQFAPSIPISLTSNLMSFFQCLGRTKESVQVRGTLKHFVTIETFLRWGVIGPTPNPQAGGPPLVGCQRLLIRYVRSYPPYPEDFPPSATWGRAMPWWQGTHLTWF